MKVVFKILLSALVINISMDVWAQGPFAPAADSMGTTAVHKDSTAIVGWISNCMVNRGLQYIGNSFGPVANVGTEQSAYGKADGEVLSLGDGGSVTIILDSPLKDHPGDDFAIFENGFAAINGTGYFLELAFVEVSSDGVNFYRFPNHSLTPANSQVQTFETLDPTNIDGLAGKYALNYGTPFDLSIMDTVLGLDITQITHIKIIDVVGSLNNSYVTYDSDGRKINDPFPTDFGSGGFDLDAIALMDTALATGVNAIEPLSFNVYPNPAANEVLIDPSLMVQDIEIQIVNMQGQVVLSRSLGQNRIDVSEFPKGVYFVTLSTSSQRYQSRFIKL